MTVGLYMDVHIPKIITTELRLRNIDVITAQEDHHDEIDDNELLNRSSVLKRPLVTCDKDLLIISSILVKKKINFSGIIFSHPLQMTIGQIINDLEIIAKLGKIEELENRVEFLPL